LKWTPSDGVAVSEPPDVETVADVLGDETARAILTAATVEPLSATELGDRCGVSLPTAYRWTERLVAADLLEERTRPREDGHHDTVYAATFEDLELRVADGRLEVEMTGTEPGDGTGKSGPDDRADRLRNMWDQL
jgi:DNA-binding transcriptional ArsR family regulator